MKDFDVRAAASSFGEPGNPPLLFLHGIRLGREIWAPHAAALAHRYHVVTLDLPGHGALANLPFTEANITAVLDEAIDQIAGDPPLVIGYSLGGYVAMRYAARFPERTRALLLADCTIDLSDWRWWPYEMGVRFSQMLPEMWVNNFVRLALHMTLPPTWASVVEQIPFDREVLVQTSAFAREPLRMSDRIASYRKPVLFVNGEYDMFFRMDERRFLHRLPQARLQIIHGVEHTAPMRRVGEFTTIVDTFAEKVFELATPKAG